MKNRNIESFLMMCLHFAIAILLIGLLLSGNIKNYIHPRFNFLLWMSSAVFLCIGSSFIPTLKIRKHHNAVALISLMIGLVFIMLMFQTKQVITTRVETITSTIFQRQSSIDVILDKTEVVNEQYLDWFYHLHQHLPKYIGKEVVLNVKVVRVKDALIVARNVMVCCAADVVALGLSTKNIDLNKYENQWLTISAVIEETFHPTFQQNVPILNVKTFNQIPPLKNELIYP